MCYNHTVLCNLCRINIPMDSEQSTQNGGKDQRRGVERDPRLKFLAEETLAILKQGRYHNRYGNEVVLAPEQEYAVSHTKLYTPEQGELLLSNQKPNEGTIVHTTVSVTDETTQAAAQRLVQMNGQHDLAVLNFASARKPGGGFLNGAPAQEESISRCSGLYPTLLTQPDYYQKNRAGKSRMYTDHIIYSPKVPWFRSDDYSLLDDKYLASVITVPAPNVGSLGRQEKKHVEKVLRHRAGKILAVAEAEGQRSLLLGAWGCGVFKNDPNMVADAFGTWLEDPRFASSFDNVTFAVFDNSQSGYVRKAFEDRYSGRNT